RGGTQPVGPGLPMGAGAGGARRGEPLRALRRRARNEARHQYRNRRHSRHGSSRGWRKVTPGTEKSKGRRILHSADLALETLARLLRADRRGGLLLELQHDLLGLADVDGDLAAVLQLAEEQLVGERTPDRVLDEARHRP